MTRRGRRIYGYVIAGLSALTLLLFLANPGWARDPAPPRDVAGMAAWLTQHPADWLTSSELADRALDTSLPQRRALWHAAYDLAHHVAPLRRNSAAAFVRGGLFHWYELGDQDKKQVLDVAAPLLNEPKFFGMVYVPLYDLTHNFAYLHKNAPKTQSALVWLSDLAIRDGLFAEYRELRGAQRKAREAMFQRVRQTEHPAALIDLLPDHLDTHDAPFVRALMEEIERKPFDATSSRRSEDLVLFALRNRMQPLQALAPLIETEGALYNPTRARLALALGNAGLASKVELTSSLTRTPEWVPYHLDRAIFEARNGDRAVAEAYLARTTILGADARVLAAAEEIATLLDDKTEAERNRQQLLATSRAPRVWKETCGENELCDHAIALQYVAAGDSAIRIAPAVLQSDEVAPYLEVFVDDRLVAEGEVKGGRVFATPAAPGLHRVEVRLVNRYTRNRVQRRVRLS